MKHFLYLAIVFPLLLTGFGPVNAQAQDMPHPLAAQSNPGYDVTEAGPLYRLTPDKIKMLDLGESAASTIIGNERHLDIFFDTSNRAALVPKEPGASHFQILNQQGQVIASGHAIIASPERDYVRIRRACTGDASGCESLSVYYCPGMCHDIKLPPGDEETAQSETGGGLTASAQ